VIPRTASIAKGPPYEVDDQRYRRFSVRKQAFVTVGYEETGEVGILEWTGRMFANMGRNVGNRLNDYSRIQYAMGLGGNALNLILGTYGMPNSQFLQWNNPHLPPFFSDDQCEEKPETLSELVKYAASLYGSDITGVSRLDYRWVYAEDLFKPFVFADIDRPREDDDAFVIPKSVDRAIVMAVAMNSEYIAKTPGALADAATGMGYSRMGILAVSLAEFIRGLGYVAIPCMNDTALSVPLAIDAGLGELGRHGLLITPQYGPCVRICKVLTNMPLPLDQPTDLGIGDFCRQCLKCAKACPSGSISLGGATFDAACQNNNPGVKKWPIKADECLRFWQANGASCANCIAVCPFTGGFEPTMCLECNRCDNRVACPLQRVTFMREAQDSKMAEYCGHSFTRAGL